VVTVPRPGAGSCPVAFPGGVPRPLPPLALVVVPTPGALLRLRCVWSRASRASGSDHLLHACVFVCLFVCGGRDLVGRDWGLCTCAQGGGERRVLEAARGLLHLCVPVEPGSMSVPSHSLNPGFHVASYGRSGGDSDAMDVDMEISDSDSSGDDGNVRTTTLSHLDFCFCLMSSVCV
jgi:hypothetical protein